MTMTWKKWATAIHALIAVLLTNQFESALILVVSSLTRSLIKRHPNVHPDVNDPYSDTFSGIQSAGGHV